MSLEDNKRVILDDDDGPAGLQEVMCDERIEQGGRARKTR